MGGERYSDDSLVITKELAVAMLVSLSTIHNWKKAGYVFQFGRMTTPGHCKAWLRLFSGLMVLGTCPPSSARYGCRNSSIDQADIANEPAFAIKAFGRIDVLVNNAGYAHLAPFEQVSAQDFRTQVDTNFFGVVNLTRAVLPFMRQQRSGHILNISSVGGRLGSPGLSAYQAAKWAVGGFSEVLAQETAPFGVKVIAVEPGGMRTDWAFIAGEAAPPTEPDYQPSVGAMAENLKRYAGNEVGDPTKIAKVILDLATRDVLPAHLLLGSDALFVFEKAEVARRAAAEAWADVSRSTDFDGTDRSAIGRMIASGARPSGGQS
jgi:NAD(P)-dependent dehydrogenase (short-subunit alcohol dehydrogenase family)